MLTTPPITTMTAVIRIRLSLADSFDMSIWSHSLTRRQTTRRFPRER